VIRSRADPRPVTILAVALLILALATAGAGLTAAADRIQPDQVCDVQILNAYWKPWSQRKAFHVDAQFAVRPGQSAAALLNFPPTLSFTRLTSETGSVTASRTWVHTRLRANPGSVSIAGEVEAPVAGPTQLYLTLIEERPLPWWKRILPGYWRHTVEYSHYPIAVPVQLPPPPRQWEEWGM